MVPDSIENGMIQGSSNKDTAESTVPSVTKTQPTLPPKKAVLSKQISETRIDIVGTLQSGKQIEMANGILLLPAKSRKRPSEGADPLVTKVSETNPPAASDITTNKKTTDDHRADQKFTENPSSNSKRSPGSRDFIKRYTLPTTAATAASGSELYPKEDTSSKREVSGVDSVEKKERPSQRDDKSLVEAIRGVVPQDNDVLLGLGKGYTTWQGNVQMYASIDRALPSYKTHMDVAEKRVIIDGILNEALQKGRFLEMAGNKWILVGDLNRARKKIGQTLRHKKRTAEAEAEAEEAATGTKGEAEHVTTSHSLPQPSSRDTSGAQQKVVADTPKPVAHRRLPLQNHLRTTEQTNSSDASSYEAEDYADERHNSHYNEASSRQQQPMSEVEKESVMTTKKNKRKSSPYQYPNPFSHEVSGGYGPIDHTRQGISTKHPTSEENPQKKAKPLGHRPTLGHFTPQGLVLSRPGMPHAQVMIPGSGIIDYSSGHVQHSKEARASESESASATLLSQNPGALDLTTLAAFEKSLAGQRAAALARERRAAALETEEAVRRATEALEQARQERRAAAAALTEAEREAAAGVPRILPHPPGPNDSLPGYVWIPVPISSLNLALAENPHIFGSLPGPDSSRKEDK